MKRFTIMNVGPAIALLVALMVAAPVMATDTAAKNGKMDGSSMGSDIRASKFIGMDIQNDQGKEVGEVKDIVLDVNTGQIRYAAVEYGGFLGMGDKLFAVPFKAFTYKQNPKEMDEHILILNVTQKQLEGAKGFNEDNWPNSADPNFTKDLDQRYGVDSMHHSKTD